MAAERATVTAVVVVVCILLAAAIVLCAGVYQAVVS